VTKADDRGPDVFRRQAPGGEGACPSGDQRVKDTVSTGIGDTLREAREAQERTLEEMARAVRARTEQLRALEEERFDTFHGDVYAKGFLRSYAIELGMDPAPLLEVYRAEVSGPEDARASTLLTGSIPDGPRRSTPPTWLVWALVGVMIVMGLAFLGTISDRFTPPSASPDEPVGPPPAPAPSVEEPEQEPEPEPEPEPVFEGVEVLLALEEASWIRVTVDGAVVLEQIVQAGETLQFQGDQEVLLRLGNAGGVRVEVNGEDQGPPGGRGEVVEVRYALDELDAA
jgi:cytoskeleton protein RodZ